MQGTVESPFREPAASVWGFPVIHDDEDDVADDGDGGDYDDAGGGYCEPGDVLAEDVSSHFVYTATHRHRTKQIGELHR